MANNKAVTKKTSKTQMKFASPEVLAAYNKAAEGGFEAAEVADLKAAEAKTTEVAKAAFAEALAKKAAKAANKRERDWPKKASLTADLKAGAILAKDSLGEVIPENPKVAVADMKRRRRKLADKAALAQSLGHVVVSGTLPTVQQTASALFREIENLCQGAGPLVVKVPEAQADGFERFLNVVNDEQAGKVPEAPVAEASCLNLSFAANTAIDALMAPKVEAPVAEVIPEQAVVIAERVAGKVKGKKAPKAPVAPAQAKQAVEAVVAQIVTEKAAEAQPLKLRLYAKGEFYFGKAAAEKLAGLPYVKVAVDGKLITLTPTKSAKDAQEVKFSHGNPVVRVSKLLAETGWSKATQDLAVTMVGDAIQVTIS